MLIQDTNDCAGTAPTIAQILQNYSGAYCGLSAHNKVFTDRFKVLWDKTLTVTANQPRASAKIYKKFKVKTYTKPNGRAMILGTHMTYSGPNSGDTSKNMLYLIAIANSDTATTMTLTAYCRFGYVDN